MAAFAVAAIAALLLVYAGFPVLLVMAAALAGPRHASAGPAPASCSIMIAAHNEAPRIAAKLESVLATVRDAGIAWQVLVADDGSTDATAALAEGFGASGVTLIRCPRGGKAAALDRLAAQATGEILVLTDADPLFEPATLPALLAPFRDPAVGAVAGSVETIGRRARFAAADALFRRYESTIRAAEDRLFGCVSADGGLFAIRRRLMPAVPADVTDDFWISTAAVAAGARIAFAPGARVHEHSIPGAARQFRRRLRITVRGLTGVWRRRALLDPRRTGWYAPALLVHKLLRRLAPLLLLPLWLATGMLAREAGGIVWPAAFVAQTGAAVIAAIACLVPRALPRPMRIVQGLALHLAALGGGVILFACGRRYTQWVPQKA